MLASHPGSFFCYVPKTPSIFGSLFGSKTAVDQAVNEHLDRYAAASARRSPAAKSAASAGQPQVQKFVYPGGGVTVQPGIQPITEQLVRVIPYVHNSKDAIVVFFGTLSNLDDLRAQHRGGLDGGGPDEAGGAGALTTTCLLDLYRKFANGRELLMLSELQGQYAFVLYDSARKQAFAARDPSGSEALYFKVDEQGGLQYTSCLEQLPGGEAARRGWRELPPGHYMLGKTVSQFALSLRQLERREKKESLDADALHMMLQQEATQEDGGFNAVRSLLRNRSGTGA